VSELLKRCATEGDVSRRALAKQPTAKLLRNVAVNVVHVVQGSEICAPPKYHAPLTILVTRGQSWTIKMASLLRQFE
jgi:hypothetical protein